MPLGGSSLFVHHKPHCSVTLYFLLLLLHRLSTLACSEGIWVYGYTGLLGQRRDNSEMGMRMGVRIKASADCVRGRPCGVEEWFSCRWIYVFSLCQMKAAEFGASCLTYRKLSSLPLRCTSFGVAIEAGQHLNMHSSTCNRSALSRWGHLFGQFWWECEVELFR